MTRLKKVAGRFKGIWMQNSAQVLVSNEYLGQVVVVPGELGTPIFPVQWAGCSVANTSGDI